MPFEYLPAGHLGHSCARLEEYGLWVPAAQSLQSLAPAAFWYLPDGQVEQYW